MAVRAHDDDIGYGSDRARLRRFGQFVQVVDFNAMLRELTIMLRKTKSADLTAVSSGGESLHPDLLTAFALRQRETSHLAFTNPSVVGCTFAITPAGNQTPVILNVQDAARARDTVVLDEWVAIRGSNLAGSARSWTGRDFTTGALPLSLDGVGAQFKAVPATVS